MRLWYKDIIPYLPKSQLVAQWREINSIFKKQDNHILINYIYEYSKDELYYYSILVLKEMKARDFKIKKWDNYDKYFKWNQTKYAYDNNCLPNEFCHYKEHNDRYLMQNYMNLQEKFDRKQKDFSKEQYEKLEKFMKEKELI